MLAFNHRLADAINACIDTAPTVASLDPDPLRYMWVDEGAGLIPAQIALAERVLEQAQPLPGHTRTAAAPVPSGHAARPSIATGRSRTVLAWIEWVEGEGDRLVARLDDQAPEPVIPDIADVFRPTAAVAGDGTAWVFFGRRDGLEVAVWASAHDGAAWGRPQQISTSDGPSFNQEVVTHPDGSLEVVWQGRQPGAADGRFGIFSRRLGESGWSETVLVSEGAEGNVWDPAVTPTADGSAYAWAQYVQGRYAVSLRRRSGSGAGRLGPVHVLTGGTDYALHPSLAATADGRLWCAFDVITVTGHGASGPTRLKRRPDAAADPTASQDGMRAPGASVPPELLPEVSATFRVVAVDETEHGVQLREAPGELAPSVNVVPSAMPRLVATPDGGLVVGYRVHRQLPLMTYYWEAAAQVLGPAGWEPPVTIGGTDATLEEPSLAVAADGSVLLATQGDGRLDRALHWTEGFGGRECPYLADHHGSVIWHGVHGAGQVMLAQVSTSGPACDVASTVVTGGEVVSAGRVESRRWFGADRSVERYTAGDYTLFWGDLHRHSLVSRCTSGDEPSLEDFYRYAWDVCEYDFWAVTDHAENSTAYQWWSIQKIADLLHVPGRFVPLYGFEWTSAARGHQNVIYGDVARGAPIFSAFADGTDDPAGLWAGLAEHPNFPAITIPHHPGSAMVHNDWDFHDPRFSRLVEVFQACRGNYESINCFRQYSDGTAAGTFTLDGLMRGHRFGLIASSDHGHGASYVGVFARSLSRADIFDALWQRRTFAATTRDVVLDLRLTGRGERPAQLMGSEVRLAAGEPRTYAAHGQAYAPIARVDLIRDGVVVHSVRAPRDLPPGWVRADFRIEWGEADVTTTWDGSLTVTADAGIVVPEFVGPEVTHISRNSVRWEHQTFSFGEPYGAQRGCVEVSIVGPRSGGVRVRTNGRDVRLTLGAIVDSLAAGGQSLDPADADHETLGTLRLQPSIGALESLERTELDLTWTDETPLDRPSFTYARLILEDGEMAWTSPIWVDPAGIDPDLPPAPPDQPTDAVGDAITYDI
ncbi:hypothetical protein KILIM_021_00360 [Kineosphaera limosa NBRC 100340]|uniref:DUF3604 domain-containing protein n=1 Tax=Kineosphaera limosa NBRC 100340 TaxID=1184609 RepID=K6WNV2_9MICO|nr:hypothetical protein KILIM_021_00360 [Kineosphaera limosa NBRC 100340]